MSNPTTNPTVNLPEMAWPPAPRNKWEREYRAFLRLLPQLRMSHQGEYVAVHEEKVVDSDRDEMKLITRVLAKIGNVDIHVGRVTDEPEPVFRSGVIRNLARPESA
jgi:hypothetical protein